MKTAIYIEDGDVQLVITPETKWEVDSLKSFGHNLTVSLWRGEFYECQGGWNRRSSAVHDCSLIIRMAKSQPVSV